MYQSGTNPSGAGPAAEPIHETRKHGPNSAGTEGGAKWDTRRLSHFVLSLCFCSRRRHEWEASHVPDALLPPQPPLHDVLLVGGRY